MALAQVGPLVGQDGGELAPGQGVEGSLGQDDAPSLSGQAVCRGRRVCQDAHLCVECLLEGVDEQAVLTPGGSQPGPHGVAGPQQPDQDQAADDERRKDAHEARSPSRR